MWHAFPLFPQREDLPDRLHGKRHGDQSQSRHGVLLAVRELFAKNAGHGRRSWKHDPGAFGTTGITTEETRTGEIESNGESSLCVEEIAFDQSFFFNQT